MPHAPHLQGFEHFRLRRDDPLTRQRWMLVCTLLLLLISIGLNLALYRFAENQYRELRRVRLDPTSERNFVAENAALPARGDGVARIVFFGDSRIANWEDLPHIEGAQLVNRGRGGETTEQMLLRLQRDVLSLQPDIVVLQAGVNDLVSLGVLPHRATDIIETCRRNLETMIARMQEAGIHVVVTTLFPVGSVPLQRRPVWSEQTREAIERVNEELRSADPSRLGSTVVDCDVLFADGRRIKAAYELDLLHLNESGYRALNRLLEPILAGITERARGPG